MYGDDLAFVHATSFGDLAGRAAAHVLERLARAPVRVGRVVDLGCGAGVTTRALADAGYDVLGVDTSAALLETARRAAPRASFHLGSAYEVELAPAIAIVAVGEVLAYHAEDAGADGLVRGLFARAAGALPAGGLLAFDVIGLEGPSLDARTFRSEADFAVLVDTREDRAARRLVRTIEVFRRMGETYRRSREVHHVRLFEEAALRGELEQAGFQVETARAYGEHALLPRRVAFFATRR